MPTLPGIPLGAATPSGNGSQVRYTYCLIANSLREAGQAAEQALRDAAWEHVTGRSPDDSPSGRYGIAAERDELRVTFTIESSGRPDCAASSGQYYATATMSKIFTPSAPD
jgi:hypothetical protein